MAVDIALHGSAHVKELRIPPIYSTMQETYTTILRTNPLLRSPRSMRSADCLRNMRPAITCRGCGNESNKHHPCLFCDACLQQLKRNLQASNSRQLQASNSFGSDASDLTAWRHSMGGSQTARAASDTRRARDVTGDTSRTRNSARELILNSSLSFQDDFPPNNQSANPSHRPPTTQARCYRKLWNEQTRTFELTHSFCGFCGPNAKRSEKLTVYCMHCRKHLCREHLLFHSQVRMYRPHALIHLNKGLNTALL